MTGGKAGDKATGARSWEAMDAQQRSLGFTLRATGNCRCVLSMGRTLGNHVFQNEYSGCSVEDELEMGQLETDSETEQTEGIRNLAQCLGFVY